MNLTYKSGLVKILSGTSFIIEFFQAKSDSWPHYSLVHATFDSPVSKLFSYITWKKVIILISFKYTYKDNVNFTFKK